MKYLLLILLSLNVSAIEYELTAKHLVVSQKLFGKIDFKQDALLLGSNAWHSSGFGLGVSVARSVESENRNYIENKFYTNKIDLLTNVSLMYKFDLNQSWAVYSQVGYTDYKTTWHVNKVKPQWSKGSDSGISYGFGLRYRINDSVSMTFGYEDLYRKHKKGYGDEKTKALSFGFVIPF